MNPYKTKLSVFRVVRKKSYTRIRSKIPDYQHTDRKDHKYLAITLDMEMRYTRHFLYSPQKLNKTEVPKLSKLPKIEYAAPIWAFSVTSVSYTHLDVYKRQQTFFP